MDFKDEIVGYVNFDGKVMAVYNDLDEPVFLLRDIAELLGYRLDNAARLAELCEPDEVLDVRKKLHGKMRNLKAVNETGLYNVLSQMRTRTARLWRVLVHKQLVQMRKDKGFNIVQQFEEWQHLADDYYWDDEKDCLMMSVTVPGGDVEQIEVDENLR